MTKQHSPTPWTVDEWAQVWAADVDQDSRPVADCLKDLNRQYLCQTNAALIVRAVNAHSELIAALTLAAEGLEVAASKCPQSGDETFIGYVLAAEKARAALAKAVAP